MIIDAHLRTSGREQADEVLRTLDEAGVERAVLVAPGPRPGEGGSPDGPAEPGLLRHGNEHLAGLVRGRGDRLTGFACLDPRDPGAPQALRHAVETLGLRGCSLLPGAWAPHDEAVQPTFAAARELGIPLLLHSGLARDGRSSRFGRPSLFEALRGHPGLRATLSQAGWPWTDEAIAVALVDRLDGVPAAQSLFRLELSGEVPSAYRRDLLHKALETLGPERLQFGSGCVLPVSGAVLAERVRTLQALLEALGVPREARRQIWSGTAAAWLGLEAQRPSGSAPESASPGVSSPAAPSSRARHPLADCRRAARTLPDPFSPLSF